jgi:RNA polymerase sigma-70 factor (ECF subfamily)
VYAKESALPCNAESLDVDPDTGRRLQDLGDQELLDGLRECSEPHFQVLYDRYFRRIYSFVYARLRNHADTEEVVQETFAAVFKSLSGYRGQSTLLSWIYGIAKNTANNCLRRAKVNEERVDGMNPEMWWPLRTYSSCTPEDHLHMRRCAEAMREQLESIAPWQSEIFVMRHMENLSISEICERTERSSDAVRSSLYRVKHLLVETAGVSHTSRL